MMLTREELAAERAAYLERRDARMRTGEVERYKRPAKVCGWLDVTVARIEECDACGEGYEKTFRGQRYCPRCKPEPHGGRS